MNSIRYTLRQLGQKIAGKTDPISLYNQIVITYNDTINREREIYLGKCYNTFIYRCWYVLQVRCVFCILAMYFMPYLNLLTLLLNLIAMTVQESAICVYHRNQKKIADPMKYMVYSPMLCDKGFSKNLYFELLPQDFESLQLPSQVKSMVLSRNHRNDGKVRFMAYNNEFLSWFYQLKKARYILAAHLCLNIFIGLLTQYFVYSPYLCFDPFDPHAISECY